MDNSAVSNYSSTFGYETADENTNLSIYYSINEDQSNRTLEASKNLSDALSDVTIEKLDSTFEQTVSDTSNLCVTQKFRELNSMISSTPTPKVNNLSNINNLQNIPTIEGIDDIREEENKENLRINEVLPILSRKIKEIEIKATEITTKPRRSLRKSISSVPIVKKSNVLEVPPIPNRRSVDKLAAKRKSVGPGPQRPNFALTNKERLVKKLKVTLDAIAEPGPSNLKRQSLLPLKPRRSLPKNTAVAVSKVNLRRSVMPVKTNTVNTRRSVMPTFTNVQPKVQTRRSVMPSSTSSASVIPKPLPRQSIIVSAPPKPLPRQSILKQQMTNQIIKQTITTVVASTSTTNGVGIITTAKQPTPKIRKTLLPTPIKQKQSKRLSVAAAGVSCPLKSDSRMSNQMDTKRITAKQANDEKRTVNLRKSLMPQKVATTTAIKSVSRTSTTTSTRMLSAVTKPSDLINRNPTTQPTDDKMECDVCKKTFRLKSNFIAHKKTHNNSGSKKSNSNKCQYCDKEFSISNALDIHLKEKCIKIPELHRKKLLTPVSVPVLATVSSAAGGSGGGGGDERKRKLTKQKSVSVESSISSISSISSVKSVGSKNNAMAPPTSTTIIHGKNNSAKKLPAHSGISRTPKKVIQCEKCDSLFLNLFLLADHRKICCEQTVVEE